MIETRVPPNRVPHPAAGWSQSRHRCSTSVGAVLVCVVALCLGAIAGWAVEFPVGVILTPLLAFAYGLLAGETLRRVGQRALHSSPNVLAGSMLLIGAITSRLAVAFYILAKAPDLDPPHGALYVLTDLFSPSPIPAVALALVLSAAVWQVRRTR